MNEPNAKSKLGQFITINPQFILASRKFRNTMNPPYSKPLYSQESQYKVGFLPRSSTPSLVLKILVITNVRKAKTLGIT